MLDAALQAMAVLSDPMRIAFLASGVLFGLVMGVIPGIGGMAGMALLLPFTYTMDSYAAIAMLLGMYSVVGTSDTIPAVLFGVPGSGGAQATVLDGHAMAKKGEAGRALASAYTASLMGGLIGAGLLVMCLPILRPILLFVGSPELLALAIFGIAMVATLSGSAPIRGLVAAGFGILFSMIGTDPQSGALRWTMDTYYLWDGLPVVPLALGLFAVPELADLAIHRRAIAGDVKVDARMGMRQGITDAIRNWWLVIRSSAIGAGVGALPGLGSSVVDWIAYAQARQTEKGAHETFGKGDVRGVIAPESANNAICSGTLIPTLAFGVPGSPALALLLSVLLIHGIVPGPEMLASGLKTTYAMVLSIAMANLLAAGLCLAFSEQFAKVASLRHSIIVPAVLVLVIVGSYQASRDWGDLFALLFFSILGWSMKQLRWPRAPLILGFILGALIERYMFISISRFGSDWLLRPMVIIILCLAALAFSVSIWRSWQELRRSGSGGGSLYRIPVFRLTDLSYALAFGFSLLLTAATFEWPGPARLGPSIVGTCVVGLSLIGLLSAGFRRAALEDEPAGKEDSHAAALHFDTGSFNDEIEIRELLSRAARFLFFMIAFMALIAFIGLIPSIPIFVVAYMWLEGRENRGLMAKVSILICLVVYVIFDRLFSIPWPSTYIGEWFPVLEFIPTI